MRWLWIGVLWLWGSLAVAAGDEGAFPLRSLFPQVPVISLSALQQAYDEVLIIDTRTRFEFETIHINKAQRISFSSRHFIKMVERLVPDHSARLVFYCNGITCTKSYRATEMALAAGYRNAVAFDAGILAWARANPERTTLLGRTPVRDSDLIQPSQFRGRLLNFASFHELSINPQTLVVDVRDAAQRRNRDGTRNELPGLPLLGSARHLALGLDQFKRRLAEGRYRDQPLLIYDAVGKQVKWLQYILERYGYADYHFLEGGVYAVTGVPHH